MAAVYILRCADGSYYTGSTLDLQKRIDQHNAGFGSVWTRTRLPVTLVWFAQYDRIDDAFMWEKQIQGWSRAKKELLISGRNDELPGWSARQRRESRDD
jgi:putative endonuclease